MAKGLPWAGPSGIKPKPGDQFAPRPGSYAPGAPSRSDATTHTSQTPQWLQKDWGRTESMKQGRS